MAGRRKRAPKIWARAIEIKAKLGRKGATRPQITEAVLKKYPEIARVEQGDLIYLGVMSIVNSVCNLKGASTSSVQSDLFRGFAVPETISLREPDATNGNTRSIERNFDSITKGELRQYIADHKATPPKESKKNSELKRFFDAIENHGADDWTVKECMKLARGRGHAVDL